MGLLATGAVGAMSAAGLFLPLEYWAQNLGFAYRSNRPPQHPYITHVDIDDHSIDRLGRWPWRRYRHAEAIEALCRLDAHTIMFDVEFPVRAQPHVEFGQLQKLDEKIADLVKIRAEAREGYDDAGADHHQALHRVWQAMDFLHSAMQRAKDDLIEDDDARVAAVLSGPEGFGQRVLLPFNLDESSRDTGLGLTAEKAARAALVRDLAAGDAAISEALGQTGAGQFLKTVRTDVFFEALIERLKVDPGLADVLGTYLSLPDASLPSPPELDLFTRLLGRDPPRLPMEARKALRTSTERVLPFLALEHRFGRPAITGVAPGPGGLFPGITPVVRINPPIRAYLDGLGESGYVSIVSDTHIDGILRRVALLHQFRGRIYPQVAFAAALRQLDARLEDIELVPGRSLTVHPKLAGWAPIRIPIDDRCRLLINWAGGVTRDPARPLDFYHNFGKHVPFYKLNEIFDLLEATKVSAKRMDDAWPEVDREVLVKILVDKLSELWWDLGDPETEARSPRLTKLLGLLEQRCQVAEARMAAQPDEDRRHIITFNLAGLRHNLDILRQNVAFLRERVKDKICIIGFTATASTDLKHIPYDPAFPGVGLHANLINTILQQRWITPAPAWQNLGWLLVPGLLVALFAAYREPVPSAGFTLLVLLAVAASFWFSFDRWGYWHHVVAPGLAVSGSLTAVSLYRQLTEGRQRREIKRAFSLYLHEAVIAEMETDPSKLSLGGQRRELTIFFSDVAGFTSISEKLSAEELVALLNEYLTAMSDIIMASGGTVDKYEGDAIMAFWGAPITHADHARRACLAALEQQEQLIELRARWRAEGRPELVCRMGLNTGPMVVGNMGSQNRFNYTVMGDAVNLGSRLEGANKAYGTYIMLAESTYLLAREVIEARKLDLLRVKGKAQPVLVYELMGRKGALAAPRQELAGVYSEGLELYLQRRFKEAESMFTEALLLCPEDGPSKVYRQRSLGYQQAPPPADWDGVHTLTEK